MTDCCLERGDGLPPILGLTQQNAYDNSAGVIPTIQLSAANDRFEMRGNAAVLDILALSDDGGNDVFVMSRAGELDLPSDDASLQVGNALGTPRVDLNHLPAETAILSFRQVNDIDTTGDKRFVHGTATDALILQDFDGAAFDDLMTFTTVVTTNVGAFFDAAVDMSLTLQVDGTLTVSTDFVMDESTPIFTMGIGTGAVNILMNKGDANGATIQLQNLGVQRFNLQMDSLENILFETFNAAAASTGITRIRNATSNWEMPAALDVVGDVTLESDLILDASTGGGDLILDSASPLGRFGDTTGSPLLIVFKGAASTSQMFWRTSLGGAVVGDKAFAHTPGEDLEIRGHDGVGFNALMTFATALVTTNVAAGFDVTLDVVGDVTLESDLILDAATGAGDLTMAGTLQHNGANLGFRAVAAIAVPAAYTVTNHNSDKVYDADVTSVDELADVLGSVVLDLINQGLLAGSVT